MSNTNSERKYFDLVAFIRRGSNLDSPVYPMVIGQMWRNDKGKSVFRIDVLPVGDRWDGSGVIEDHDERVKRAEERRQRGDGGEGPLP